MMEGGKYVVEATDLNEFGFGDNLSGAIVDLQAAIAELYLALEADQKRLGPDLAAVWGILSRKVRRADAASRSSIVWSGNLVLRPGVAETSLHG